jgi:miniconductance mechanosensitive channel
MENETAFAAFIEVWLHDQLGVNQVLTELLKLVILVTLMLLIALILWFLAQQIINRFVNRLVKRTDTNFDDILQEKRVFRKLGHIIPVVVISWLTPVVFTDYPEFIPTANRITSVFNVLIIIRVLHHFINALQVYLAQSHKYHDKPIASYTQLGKILIWAVGTLILASLIIGKNPLYMFTALGAVSAVLILVFKDTILGFIASIQLSVNNMIRIGDWVSIPKYGADGDVIEINLTTVKVRNWDNTISTVPTYSFISDSFKNWRGMQESGGRRIKRAVNLKISSIRLADEEMLQRFEKIELVREYIKDRREQITRHNAENQADTEASIVNGRRMTNIGVFRAYIRNYLSRNSNLNQEMIHMVRQMDPTEHGVPLEIYCFSKIKTWVEYEIIQSDLFDHILAVVPYFDLEVFEVPAGSDFQKLANLNSN